MSALHLFISHLDSSLGSISKLNKPGLRVLCTSGMAAALCFGCFMPTALQAQAPPPIAGTTTAVGSGFSQPYGVAVDKNGDVFVADYGNNAVKEIIAGTGGAAPGTVNNSSTIVTVGSGFNHPQCVTVDENGDVFIADFHDNVVKEIVAGTGGAAPGHVNTSSTISTVGHGFDDPQGLAVDGKGDVFVADYGNSVVKEIVAGTGGAAPGTVNSSSTVKTVGIGFSNPKGLAVDAKGDVFVADFNNHLLKEIMAGTGNAPSGTVDTSSAVDTVGSGFEYPEGVAVDRNGNVFVEYSGKSVSGGSYSMMKEIVANAGKVSDASQEITVVGSGQTALYGVAVDGSGNNVFAVDPSHNAVEKIQQAAR